ncbi:MAG: TonB-dependent receptor [Candidatus Stygibacter australis]|nr:TonB-dependent receptor [Candidatus Stygibacter australis]
MKKSFVIMFLVLLLSVNLFAIGGNIFGEVKSAKSGDPLEMVVVRITDINEGNYTNSQGKFYFKDVPLGTHTLSIELIGYKPQQKEIVVKESETTSVNFNLEIDALQISGSSINALRSIPGESPVAFTELSNEDIADRYTTQDMPELIEDVPGVFASGSGLGEAELSIRGFDAEKIQVLINGIPVNDPESQKVYWSNWTGLSSNVNSVQVQRGASSSLYGSGAFGGSLNIETMKATPKAEWSLRSSVNSYQSPDETANGQGEIEKYQPINYNAIVRYNSGDIGNFNLIISTERKAGDSYIEGTSYDGWSFGAESELRAGPHKMNFSLIAAPQSHNQARTTSDPDLFDTLGRNYNRSLSGYQENYYFKPQFSIRDNWKITDQSSVMTNFFVTMGVGGGKYLKNDYFDVETGEVRPLDADMDSDRRLFGKHAAWIYEQTGELPEGLIIDPTNDDFYIYTYQGEEYRFRYSSATNLITSTYENGFENDMKNQHKQLGINSYYQNKVNHYFEVIAGYEFRYWMADHYVESNDFHYAANDSLTDAYNIYDQTQVSSDYSSSVRNLSGFCRFNISPSEKINFMADVQAAQYYSEVEENPIQIFDFGTGQFLDEYIYNTKEMTDNDTLLFDDEDYKRTWEFVSPKFGMNYKASDKFSMFVNYSIAKKEPKVRDWYSYKYGPNQDGFVDGVQIKELKPEKVVTYEFGYSYRDFNRKINLNIYRTHYLDKIGSVTMPVDGEEQTLTTNYGDATHQGIELSFSGKSMGFEYGLSGTLSRNRWNKMNAETIGNTPAEELIGNVVPFSPEQMASGNLAYTFKYLPNDGSLKVGTDFKWWDEYYCNEENEYERPIVDYIDENGVTHYTEATFDSKLPHFFTVNMSVTYDCVVFGNKELMVKVDFKNVNNRDENYTKGYVGTDYGRNDYMLDEKNLYVVPAPKFNIATTVELKF